MTIDIHPDHHPLLDDWLQRTSPGASAIAAELFENIVRRYREPQRHYHTLAHIQSMWSLLEPLSLPSPVFWATWYHDAIYDPARSDNEERSADLAQDHLRQMGIYPEPVVRMIHATKTHKVHRSTQTAVQSFLDADMAILGSPPAIYERYVQNVRSEYSMYPDEIYYPGRAGFLRATLAMPKIYGTHHFRQLFGQQARENLNNELKSILAKQDPQATDHPGEEPA